MRVSLIFNVVTLSVDEDEIFAVSVDFSVFCGEGAVIGVGINVPSPAAILFS